jgi:O-antigen ligase
VAGTIFLLKSIDTIVRRFERAPVGSAMARADFNAAARLMAEDNPFGVGMNMFSHALQTEYAERVGIDPESYGASGLAHHIYYLTLAETGWLGLLGYLLLIVWPLFIAIRTARKLWGSIRAEVLIGCAVGLCGFYMAGFLEWAARQTALSYMFFLIAALVEGIRRSHLLEERQRALRERERELEADG